MDWMPEIFDVMSPVARPVSWASSLTSFATTAKPLPASPARAASMVAMRASRLVCSAIEVIVRTICSISSLARVSWSTIRPVSPAVASRAAARRLRR
nr:hypothetical protein [Kineosporia sp. R_H_3]